MTTILIIRSHEKYSVPDGREVAFTGTPDAADRWFNDLTEMQRYENRYLFSEDGAEAVGYQDWEHAGVSCR